MLSAYTGQKTPFLVRNSKKAVLLGVLDYWVHWLKSIRSGGVKAALA